MSLTEFNGLPTHVLFAHFVVVMVPLTSLVLVGCAVWPGGARRLGIALPLLALATLASVPLTTYAGEWLRDQMNQLRQDELLEKHANRGDVLLPWVVALVVMAIVVWWITRQESAAASGRSDSVRGLPAIAKRRPRVLHVVVAVLCVIAAVGATIDVYLVGDSGAKAVWDGVVAEAAPHYDTSATTDA